jgi:steroid delta-isomerase-like uncharacterized protein
VSAANRAALLAAWEAIDGDRGADAVDDWFAPDCVRHSEDGRADRDQYRETLRALKQAFPDQTGSIGHVVAEGDLVAYRWEATGTHAGPYLGIPATGRRVTAAGLTISRFRDGLIVEEWASWNKASVLHRLGIIPLDPR